MQPHSLIPVLRRIFKEAGLPAELYSRHSMTQGFAIWTPANGWDSKRLMSYVRLKDVKSALGTRMPECRLAAWPRGQAVCVLKRCRIRSIRRYSLTVLGHSRGTR